MSSQIKNSDFGLCNYFRVASSLFKNWLKFSEVALYRADILKLDDLVSILTAETSKVYSA
jgi:hypothetical protein